MHRLILLLWFTGVQVFVLTWDLSAQRRLPQRPSNAANPQGIVADFDFGNVDDLLNLSRINAKMVIFRSRSEADVSSAHLARFQAWIAEGGIAYFYGDSIFGSLFRKLDLARPVIRQVQKESGARFDGKVAGCIGELFVKGALPTIQILDHPITVGVSQLYV